MELKQQTKVEQILESIQLFKENTTPFTPTTTKAAKLRKQNEKNT
jgi:hypothetical protein